MQFPPERFHSAEITKRFQLGDTKPITVDTKYRRYSYESVNRLYEVDVRESDGNRTYHVNCSFDVEPQSMHRLIEAHFSL